jgi:hypothetical protein
MISYITAKYRVATVRRIFREYVESYREYLKLAERRSLELAPERILAWQAAFRLQNLLNERQGLRFEYLALGGKFEPIDLRSLSSISERLDGRWSASEEASLMDSDITYKKVCQEIVEIQSKWDPNALGDSGRAVDQDLKYCDARRSLADRTRKLEARLAE